MQTHTPIRWHCDVCGARGEVTIPQGAAQHKAMEHLLTACLAEHSPGCSLLNIRYENLYDEPQPE